MLNGYLLDTKLSNLKKLKSKDATQQNWLTNRKTQRENLANNYRSRVQHFISSV